ncbi:MAG: alpha/beta fold hydrolase, partial [bacterium]
MKTSKTLCVMGIILMSAISVIAQNGDAKGSYASVNGLKMYYEIHGTGPGKPGLVLLHGGMVTIETSFDNTRPAFNKTWKTIAIEQQAHGHTNDIKDRPLTVEQMAEDTYA